MRRARTWCNLDDIGPIVTGRTLGIQWKEFLAKLKVVKIGAAGGELQDEAQEEEEEEEEEQECRHKHRDEGSLGSFRLKGHVLRWSSA